MEFLTHTAIEENDGPSVGRRGFRHDFAPLTSLHAAMIATGEGRKQAPALAAAPTACQTPGVATHPIHVGR